MKRINILLLLTLLSMLLVLGVVACDNKQVNTFNQIQKKGKLLIGTEASYRPFEYHNENDEIIGFDIDIAKAIAKELGLQLEIKDIDFDGLIPSLKTGKFDMVIAAMTITEARKKAVSFSSPYFNASQVIAVVSSNNKIKGVADLKGKRVGVQLGTTGDLEVSERSGIEVTRYEKIPQAFIDLKNGRIDAVVNDMPVTTTYVRERAGVKIIGEPFTEEYYGIALRKDDHKLQEEIDKALKKIKEKGIYDKIYTKWFK